MKRKIVISALLAALLCGCTPIDYSQSTSNGTTAPDITVLPDTSASNVTSTPITTEKSPYNESTPVTYDIETKEFMQLFQLEDYNGHTPWKGLDGYTGNGYVALNAPNYSTLTVDVPTSQFYRIGICVCAEDAAVTIITGNSDEVVESDDGDYDTISGTVQGAIYAEEVLSFKEMFIEGVYLEKGENNITFQALRGSAYIDYVVIENGETSADNRYNVSNAPRNKNATPKTVGVMDYLSDIFGKQTLTAQYVTAGTNTELYAIFNASKRYPAIRCSDLMQYSPSYISTSDEENKEIELACEWAEQGGLLSFSWSWYSPSDVSHYFASKSDFKLDEAVTDMELVTKTPDELKALYEGGFIEKSTYGLMCDIDSMAETLKPLLESDAVVLWRPLMEAGNSWYWWGNCANDSYIWLWKTMYDRFTSYHELNNLLWVWNGEDYGLYPGDNYVDIVGEDIYNSTPSTNNNRFIKTLAYGDSAKPAALTECGILPDIDAQFRDKAMWLWFALFRGDYIVNSNGTLNGKNSAASINYIYNHELTLTLDELPDFITYGISQ